MPEDFIQQIQQLKHRLLKLASVYSVFITLKGRWDTSTVYLQWVKTNFVFFILIFPDIYPFIVVSELNSSPPKCSVFCSLNSESFIHQDLFHLYFRLPLGLFPHFKCWLSLHNFFITIIVYISRQPRTNNKLTPVKQISPGIWLISNSQHD